MKINYYTGKHLFIIYFILISIYQQNAYSQTVKPVPRPEPYEKQQVQQFTVLSGDSYHDKWEKTFNYGNNLENFRKFVSSYVETIKKQPNVPKEFIEYIETHGENYPYHPEFIEEMKAISQITDIKFSDIFIINIVYELFSYQDACTSVVIQNEQGQILHGRDLDYGMMEQYGKIAIQFNYLDEKDNNILYSTSQFLGYVVVHTGVRQGQYSISLNQRNQGSREENWYYFQKGAFPAEFLITETIKQKDNYKDALRSLQSKDIISSCYYIIAGVQKYQGTIIARNRISIAYQEFLEKKNWFIVVTNYDKDKKDLDGRKTAAAHNIEQIGKSITYEQLLSEVLSKYPNFNINTIESIIMNPDEHKIEDYKWYG